MSTVSRMLLGGVRHYAKPTRFAGAPGVKYGYITYYPKTPDEVDPPVEPAKLFKVQRIKPFKGNPWWEKEILAQLRLDGKKSDIAIVKNIPEMNARLWRIKHLVRITPIKCPDGLPKDGDLNGTYLHENGTFSVSHKVKVDQERIDAIDEYTKDWKKLDKETIKKELRLKWLNPL